MLLLTTIFKLWLTWFWVILCSEENQNRSWGIYHPQEHRHAAGRSPKYKLCVHVFILHYTSWTNGLSWQNLQTCRVPHSSGKSGVLLLNCPNIHIMENVCSCSVEFHNHLLLHESFYYCRIKLEGNEDVTSFFEISQIETVVPHCLQQVPPCYRRITVLQILTCSECAAKTIEWVTKSMIIKDQVFERKRSWSWTLESSPTPHIHINASG